MPILHKGSFSYLHVHFSEKWPQQWRERWGKAGPCMGVLGMGGGRGKKSGVLYYSYFTAGS